MLAFTVEDIASQLGKSESYVRTLIRQGLLPAKKAGKTSIVLAADFALYLESLPDV